MGGLSDWGRCSQAKAKAAVAYNATADYFDHPAFAVQIVVERRAVAIYDAGIRRSLRACRPHFRRSRPPSRRISRRDANFSNDTDAIGAINTKVLEGAPC